MQRNKIVIVYTADVVVVVVIVYFAEVVLFPQQSRQGLFLDEQPLQELVAEAAGKV